jgi:predicted DNA-binding protein (UPF0251 family)
LFWVYIHNIKNRGAVKMPRPHRGRKIGHLPDSTYFKPAGIPVSALKTTTIGLDELEAMRLVDGEGLKQTEAAEQMDISQSTIARLLASGRKKVALALAHGEALRLEKGVAPLDFQKMPDLPPQRGRHGRDHQNNSF